MASLDFPYEGDPPSTLVQETNDGVDAAISRFHEIMDELHSRGFMTVVLVSAYDQLTGTTHLATAKRGDYHAHIGMAQRFVARQLDE